MVKQTLVNEQPIAKCRDPETLSNITDVIHDCSFNVDEVEYDQNDRCLRIPFEMGDVHAIFPKKNAPTKKMLLKINQVESYVCEDRQRIGRYDFNELRFLDESNDLIIETGIPTEFRAKLQSIDIVVYLL